MFIQHCKDGRKRNKSRTKENRQRSEAKVKSKLFQLLSLQYLFKTVLIATTVFEVMLWSEWFRDKNMVTPE